jgi:hypothetical protein
MILIYYFRSGKTSFVPLWALIYKTSTTLKLVQNKNAVDFRAVQNPSWNPSFKDVVIVQCMQQLRAI